jgi:predicted phage gp36 major capsid-like protein
MTSETLTSYETKVAGAVPVEVGQAFDEFMSAFEAFKQANDERLKDIERRMSADAVTVDKVERINRTLDELTLKARRPQLGADSWDTAPAHRREHKAAFESNVRKGETGGLASLEAKSLSAGSDADGGYLVPDETETEIGRLLSEASPIRAIAGVRQVSAAVYKKPFAITGAQTGWVGETAARPETTAPTLAELQFPAMELYAMPAATQTLLDDAAVSIDQWIAEEVQAAFAEQEGTAFVTGDGANKPRGFLVYALKAGYRQNAHWVMNRKTQAQVRKLKDGDGNYLWQPAATADGRASLVGFPVTEAEDMPDISANAYAMAFGDFRRGYLIVDRLGVRILRDPYSAKPYVLFYTTKRVGGGVQNFEAIKLLRFASS